MEKNRDQVVKMLQEQIGRLQKRIGYLEKLLDGAPKTMQNFFIPCSREGQMFIAKGQQNPIPKRVRRDIIHSAGISGRTAYVRRKEEYRSNVRTVLISDISSLQATT